MGINPYLTFGGNCAEAFAFYSDVLGGEIVAMQKFSDMPDQSSVTHEQRDLVLHAQLKLGDNILMASDHGGSVDYLKPQGFSLQTGWPSAEKGWQVFQRLSEGGEVVVPFGETFWAAGFGVCRDRFGIPWMVNCDDQR